MKKKLTVEEEAAYRELAKAAAKLRSAKEQAERRRKAHKRGRGESDAR